MLPIIKDLLGVTADRENGAKVVRANIAEASIRARAVINTIITRFHLPMKMAVRYEWLGHAPGTVGRKEAALQMVKKILLWLFVINLGITFGAGLYESRIVVPDWVIHGPGGTFEWDAAAARAANTGLRFWVFISTIPLTLLAVANLVAGWLAGGTIRKWWVSAALVAIIDRVFTFSYFIPTMICLMHDDSISNADAVATFSQWTTLNHVRHLIVFVAWLLALRALSLLASVPNRQPHLTDDTRDGE